MKIDLVREPGDECTFGELFINGALFCQTMEDMDRKLEDGGVKIKNHTAIPRGRYHVTTDWSNRFKREMIHILDVPQFTGIRIHSGNTTEDTEGCILVGSKRGYLDGEPAVLNSRHTSETLFRMVVDAIDRGETVEIEIV